MTHRLPAGQTKTFPRIFPKLYIAYSVGIVFFNLLCIKNCLQNTELCARDR